MRRRTEAVRCLRAGCMPIAICQGLDEVARTGD